MAAAASAGMMSQATTSSSSSVMEMPFTPLDERPACRRSSTLMRMALPIAVAIATREPGGASEEKHSLSPGSRIFMAMMPARLMFSNWPSAVRCTRPFRVTLTREASPPKSCTVMSDCTRASVGSDSSEVTRSPLEARVASGMACACRRYALPVSAKSSSVFMVEHWVMQIRLSVFARLDVPAWNLWPLVPLRCWRAIALALMRLR
mmetsp:Transcript_14797/g.61639  ORF Transcript_14797/g.61639 Transcript_14797/m.61639 type:complete len:206 (-) Transcript_14797:1552-2169(-)